MKKYLLLLSIVATSANSANIYLCKAYTGGSFWSSDNCANKSALIDRIINVPDNIPFDLQVNIAQQSLNQVQTNTQTYTQTNTTKNTQSQKKGYCEAIDRQIVDIDNQARLPQSSQMQSYLRDKRKSLRDEQYRNCR